MKPYNSALHKFLCSAVGIIAVAGLMCLPASFAWAEDTAPTYQDEPIQPIEAPKDLDPDKIELGRKLFNDVRLSKGNKMSCASCHITEQGGAMHLAHSPPGASGKSVPINVPTFFGSGLNFMQFWDGRAATLEDQIDGPITGPDEMGSSWPEITGKVKNVEEYYRLFQKAYKSPPNQENIKDAIATFERSQVPLNSPFDRYLKGDKNAIDKKTQDGYALFKNLGCASCHQGQNVGGNMLQKFGIIENYFEKRGNIIEKDYGHFNVTHLEEDRYVFKVPSLRNVELTAPYFHDGSAKDLDTAVDVMAQYQLGRELSQEERDQLVAFLRSLTGTLNDTSADKVHE